MCIGVYWSLTKFVIPLLLTNTLKDVGEQFLKRSLASSTDVVLELASFAIAFRIFSFFTEAANEFKYLSIVLLKTSKDRKNILIFAGCYTIFPLLILILLGASPLGYYVIEDFHQVSSEVGDKSRIALLIFSFYPVLDAIGYVHFGVLIRYKHGLICGLAFISDVGGKIITVVIALSLKSNLSVMYIPLIASYVGLLLRFTITMVAYYRLVHHKVCEATDDETHGVGFKTILRIYLPLLASRSMQLISRPLLNLFVARDRKGGNTEEDSLEALAILSVVYPFGRIFYGFLNETKVLETTFTKKDESGRSDATVRQVRFFIFSCFCVSVMLNIIFFWVPGITVPVVMAVANVDKEFAKKSVTPFRIFSFHCIPVIFRDSITGWLFKVKRTSAIFPGALCRICLIIIFGIVAPTLGLHGAPMVTAVLLSGFCIEALVILIAACYVKWSRKKQLTNESEDVSLVPITVPPENEMKKRIIPELQT